jgi:hypothetical protein
MAFLLKEAVFIFSFLLHHVRGHYPQLGPMHDHRAPKRRPSWFKWAEFGSAAGYLFAIIGLLALDDSFDFSRRGLLLALPLIWIACLTYPLALDLVPRHCLKISSKRGLEASLLGWIVAGAAATALLVWVVSLR